MTDCSEQEERPMSEALSPLFDLNEDRVLYSHQDDEEDDESVRLLTFSNEDATKILPIEAIATQNPAALRKLACALAFWLTVGWSLSCVAVAPLRMNGSKDSFFCSVSSSPSLISASGYCLANNNNMTTNSPLPLRTAPLMVQPADTNYSFVHIAKCAGASWIRQFQSLFADEGMFYPDREAGPEFSVKWSQEYFPSTYTFTCIRSPRRMFFFLQNHRATCLFLWNAC